MNESPTNPPVTPNPAPKKELTTRQWIVVIVLSLIIATPFAIWKFHIFSEYQAADTSSSYQNSAGSE